LLETLPDRDAGGETTSMLLRLYMDSGQVVKAADLSEKVFAQDPKQHAVPLRVANALVELGDFDRAQGLLGQIRSPLTDSGEHEALAQALSRLIERRPGHVEPLEWLVDLYGRASDSFRLPDALAQLAYTYETSGQDAQALATYEKLLERTPEDETIRRKYQQLRTKSGLQPMSGEIAPPVKVAPTEDAPKPAAASTPVAAEPALDEETQRYVTQALTDVDLFSSYGLTQKAIDLLESVLTRAPQHATVLERLLDLSVGAGDDRRTVELASMLEKLSDARNDRAGAERFAELRRRFERAAGITSAAQAQKAAPTPAVAAPPPEFSVPMIQAELDEPAAQKIPEVAAEPAPAVAATTPAPVESAVHEVDLSDEWAALSEQLESAMHDEPASAVAESTPAPVPAEAAHVPAEAAAEAPSFELEPQLVAPLEVASTGSMESDSLLAELAGDLESVTASLGGSAVPAHASPQNSAAPAVPVSAPPAHPTSGNGSPAATANGRASGGSLEGPLGDLFEEFRSELGESNKDDEDLETHYNLGIAYREMGLLEEAISEFQKVASSADKGPAFRYAMQCSTLLGLAFMEKGQPAIAAIWYERALKTPGLDQESILALRYDLGVAQELAGDTKAAFTSFSQVYAMNIDYRDVSERIALLGKAR